MNAQQHKQILKLAKALDRAYDSEEESEDDWDLYPAAAQTIRSLVEEVSALQEQKDD